MSTQYETATYVGKWFKDSKAALQFLVDKEVLDTEQIQEIEDIGLEEFLETAEIGGQTLNYFSGCGFVVGKKISSSDVKTATKEILDAENRWYKSFPHDKPEFLSLLVVC